MTAGRQVSTDGRGIREFRNLHEIEVSCGGPALPCLVWIGIPSRAMSTSHPGIASTVPDIDLDGQPTSAEIPQARRLPTGPL